MLTLGILQHMPNSRKYISRETLSLAKKVKVPLILLGTVTGLGGGLVMSFVRGLTISVENKDGFTNPQTYYFAFICNILGLLQVFTLNRLMWLYQQIQIQPIFETTLIVFNLTSGAILMREYELYTENELIQMMAYMGLCLLGVMALIYKLSWLNRLFGHVDIFSATSKPSPMFKWLDQDDREYLHEALKKIEDRLQRQEVQLTAFLVLNMEKEEVGLK